MTLIGVTRLRVWAAIAVYSTALLLYSRSLVLVSWREWLLVNGAGLALPQGQMRLHHHLLREP